MSEPTLKDVLDAISRMQGDLARLDGKVDAYRAETKSDLAKLESKVDAHRTETAKGFADWTGSSRSPPRSTESSKRTFKPSSAGRLEPLRGRPVAGSALLASIYPAAHGRADLGGRP